MVAALTDAVDAYTTVDRHRREMLRARVNNARRDGELRLNDLTRYAADARWERTVGVLCASIFPGATVGLALFTHVILQAKHQLITPRNNLTPGSECNPGRRRGGGGTRRSSPRLRRRRCGRWA
jgi:hypothetical protein